MVKVSITKCSQYDQKEVDLAVHRCLELIGGIENFVKPGQRVLLKVNALTPRPPEAAVTTHPALIKAVVNEVRQAGGIPLVGDSSGGIIAGQAPTRQTFQVAGIAAAARESGAELVNFDAAGATPVKSNGPVDTLYIARSVLEADVVVSMPKLKTHSATLFTGAIKNMYGSIPGFRKAEYHRMAPKLKEFTGVLVDVFAAAKPSLAIMDAITGMEGNGPSAGTPRKVGLILASEDCVALDAVSSYIIGLPSTKVLTTVLADQRGLGTGELARIEAVGEILDDVVIKDYQLPSNAMLENMPAFLVRGFLGILQARPEIDKNTCLGCHFCIESCPVEAMKMVQGIPEIDYAKCISCLCCQELCPQKAVTMKQFHRIGRIIAGLIAYGKKRKRDYR